MTVDTAWGSGRLGGFAGPKRLLFGNTYEDVEIERRAFQGKRCVFCIASSGATAVVLAAEHDVVACDINPVQLAYAERRARGGPPETGDAERVMNFARALMPLVGWRRELVGTFLALTDPDEQLTFWQQHLNTRRFRAGLDLLMSRVVLRSVYSPRFLSFLPPRFGAVLRKRLERGFARHQNALNPYARALLLGEPVTLPSRSRCKIRFVAADAATWLESCPAGSFDGFALSNILDGAESRYRERVCRAIGRVATSDAVVVLRSFAEPEVASETNVAGCDRSMLWGMVEILRAETFRSD
jgi:hypothetical protein